MPRGVAALHKRRAVESSQAGQRRDRKSGAFVQAHCPAVVDVFKNWRRAFDDCDFIVHKVTYSAGIYHNYGRNSFQNLIRIFGVENTAIFESYNTAMSKLTPKIILEGTRLTFKTDVAFALNEHPRIVGPRKYKYHSPLISAEWCAFTNFP